MASGGGSGAVDTFLKVTCKKFGVVKGDSKAKGHEEEIDVLAWSFGVSKPLDAGTQQASGRRSWTDLTFTKYVDRASLVLLSALTNNDTVKAELVVRTVGENPIDTLKVTVSDGILRSISTGSAGGTSMSETVAISFRRIEADYIGHPSSRMKGATVSFMDEISNL